MSIDYRITRLLQKNGRMPNTEIAKKLGVSEATVRNRLQALIKEERIQVLAVVNPFKLKSGILGNLRVKVQKKQLERVGNELSKLDELWYIAQLVGSAEFCLFYLKDGAQRHLNFRHFRHFSSLLSAAVRRVRHFL